MFIFGTWELIIIAVLLGIFLVPAALIVWLVLRNSKKSSVRLPLPSEEQQQPGQDKRP